jgi:CPA2 family monovalent cation:H+ antiporter-2
MDPLWLILRDMLALLAAAMILGAIAERLKQSAIVGYMLAGVIIAPLIATDDTINAISQLGIALLLFSIGLEFSFERLKRFGVGPWLLGGCQVVATMAVVMPVCLGFGMSAKGAFVVGAALSLSSTAVVLRALQERAEVDTMHGRRALGILLFQDLAVIPLVLIVSSLGGDVSAIGIGKEMLQQFGVAIGLFAGFFLINRFVLPLFLAGKMLSRNRELPILFAVVIALAASWSAQALGISSALGAFVAGILLGESRLATQIRADISALRTLFVTLFFSSIGMLLNVPYVLDHPMLVFIAIAFTLIGKAVILSLIGVFARHRLRHAVALGFTVSQIGVFSFVLLGIGLQQELITQDTFDLMVAVTIATIFVTPYLVVIGPATGQWLERKLRHRAAESRYDPNSIDEREDDAAGPSVLIMGFGPAGRAVAEQAKRNQWRVTVVDLNQRAILEAKEMGYRAFVGDVSAPAVLEMAGIEQSNAVVVTLPEAVAAQAVVRQIRAICPAVHVIVRSRYHRWASWLEQAGAHAVVDEENTVGGQLAVELRRLVEPHIAEADSVEEEIASVRNDQRSDS